ncbi:coiled-coil domain-containing protein 183-like [Morone saxatilis]|uniref:coiled-coil domain-containing protein 183-like n=1 Tax=Morone saxatilis TaxID=34816 RepID=UPI0015E23CEB|nr:coiled-coil domain-containing protein 183-like [Morone saxatilis]
MNYTSSTKMKDATTSTPHRIKTSETQTEAQDSAAKQVLDSHDKRQKPLSKPGLSLEKKNELEKQRRHVLINEHNRLTFAVKEKEAKLKELQEFLEAKNLAPTTYNSEDTLKQRIRELENNLDKMKIKIIEARKIQTVYQHIREHLQEEVCRMSKDLDQTELAVALGEAEVDKASKQVESAAAAAHSIMDLVNKVVSQRATKEQLLIEVTQYKELIRQEAETLADLEVQYTELKFSEKPATTWFDKLKEQLQAWLNQEVDRVQRLQAELKQSQDLLDSVEFGVNNFYFRMSCVALEELPSAFSTDSLDKLRDISARLPTLQQRALEKEPEISGLDQDKVYDLLEELNMMELKNNKRPTTPIGTPQLSDDEEECSPSREEIKRRSIRLIESRQNRRSARKACKK